MNNRYFVADVVCMVKRKLLAEEFYRAILDPAEIPFIVTDEASLYDIYIGDEIELIQKIREKYGVVIDIQYFKIPFWKLLDYLEESRIK